MVSNSLKARVGIEKTKRATKYILPIFLKESVSDFTNEILREDEQIRNAVIANPSYRGLLEQKVAQTFQQYKGVLRGAKLIDSWDRVTSAIGMVADAVGPFTGGTSYIASLIEEVPELIPKAVYAVYYGKKTKDLKALPYWGAAEAASFIPYVGDAIDMTNIYVHRARKFTKDKVKNEFRQVLKGNLEEKVLTE